MPLTPKLRAALLLAGLAATLATAYWASRLPSGDEVAAAALPGTRAPGSTAGTGHTARGAEAGGVDLTRLKRDPSTGPDRDLFDPRSFAPPPPARRAGAAQKPSAAPAAAAAPPPAAPPPPYVYLGRLAEGEHTSVFLSNGDRNLVVKAGDVLDNTYRVDEIGPSTLVLTYLPQNIKQTLPIGAPQ
jgi:hypothetical protein